jgi:flavin-dependent dehydrogenase
VRSKYVIGADGENSQFRKWSCLEQTRYEEIRFSARQHFRLSPWSNFAEVYWGRNCQIVIAPVACDELCVAVTSREPFLRLPEALAQVPAVAHRLRCASPTNAMRGSRAALRRLSRVCRGRFALLGDASGSIDPLTGEGIGLAFKQAEALAEAIARDDLQSYQTAHDRLSRIPRLMSRLLLLMDKHPRFREAGLRILAAEPSLFSQLLNLNVGNLALSNLRFSNLLRLGWQALIPRPQL